MTDHTKIIPTNIPMDGQGPKMSSHSLIVVTPKVLETSTFSSDGLNDKMKAIYQFLHAISTTSAVEAGSNHQLLAPFFESALIYGIG